MNKKTWGSDHCQYGNLTVCLFGLSFTVIDSMKSVLKKTKGSDILKEIEEPAVKSNPLARGKKNATSAADKYFSTLLLSLFGQNW